MTGNTLYPRNGTQQTQVLYSPNLLDTLANGINNRKVIIIEYESYEKGITHREIEPMAVVFKDKKRNLIGWCRLRNDYRSFRLDRINTVKLKQEDFERRADFNVDEFQDSFQPLYDNPLG